ncbi:J domain-containing protein [Azohydromonas australica]|uniref:J domain-containing protein n=1 Tax=Azohydromonas australica TaxID=364039 RepID=UPI0003FAF558|nr:J domain-containing protein [Azohydromonas australica]
MSRIDALQITPVEASPALTPQQKRFNSLIRQIEQARRTLATWHDSIPVYGTAYTQVLLPLQTAIMAARRDWSFALDAQLTQHRWAKAERETLRTLLCEAAGELLGTRDDDAELKALFDKHAEVDFDTERQKVALAMKDLAQAVTGLDLGDDEGIRTEADFLERMQQGMRAQEQAEEAAAAEREAATPRRRKTAAQQRKEAEAQQATQSLREIFRQLASLLHPDRETDPRQREAKNALMQKVNQAYAANDLLSLLELQLQVEQIDANHIAKAGNERLKHYNKVLSEQLQELKHELARVEAMFRLDFNLDPGWGLDPRKLGQLLEGHARRLRAELQRQQRDLLMLEDVGTTKRWLKRQQQLLRQADFGTDFF